MRLKKLAALCGKSKTVIIKKRVGADDTMDQFISDGKNLYSAITLPELDEDNVLNVLDVPGHKQEEWCVRCFDLNEEDEVYIADSHYSDTPLRVGGITLSDGRGTALLPLLTKENRLYWIEVGAIEPIRDAAYEFWLRAPKDSNHFVVVKAGIFAIAAIMPVALRESAEHNLRQIVALMDKKPI